MKNTNETETVTINYDVLDFQDERVRGGRITGTFSDDMPYTDMIDALVERAWEREAAKANWAISNTVVEER